MEKPESIEEIADHLQNFQLHLSNGINTYEQLHREIADRINHLITSNFPLLVAILYRLDISEKKLKQLLHQHRDITAGDIMAKLIIERQQQKLEARKKFTQFPGEIPDEEKW